ncbi:FAD-dependent monooxygenase [Castellaniella sp. S9]|uniref:FAD-dependent monooxygenase n=1 Tax=Castellaniella sp. S9 TaxID=2993652 RepID=UPI0022B54909|nr:FAD-dependent monooxygenase [Castellaniella sp. S9]
MTSPAYDLMIVGTGPVGCALALCLARRAPDPGRIALLGPQPAPRAAGEAIDPRTLALNHGSRTLLESLGAWPAHAAEILTVHVSQAGHLGRTLIDRRDLGVPRLGCVVSYDAVLAALHAAAAGSGIRRILERPGRPQPGRPVRLRAGEADLDAHAVLISDGERPHGVHREYGQHAVLSTIRAARPEAGRAFERFTRHGPLALLPHPDGADLYSLVWCVPPARAQALEAMADAAFGAELQRAFGQRLGALRKVGAVHVFPLSMHAGPALRGTGVATVGNAAQTLHPVAGQGLNLGLRDAAQLAGTLAPWLARPQDDVQPVLAHFARRRRLDRGLTLAVTDTLPRVFATGNPLTRHLGGAALAALDLLPALRAPLARHLLQGQRG